MILMPQNYFIDWIRDSVSDRMTRAQIDAKAADKGEKVCYYHRN